MNETITKTTNTRSIKLVNVLSQEIAEGRFAPGTLLPTDRELAGRYSVSTNTVRKSLLVLQRQGLLARQPQRGVVVVSPGLRDPGLKRVAFISPMASVLANEFLAGLTDGLDDDRFVAATYITREDLDKYRKIIIHVADQRPSGMVIWVQTREYCEVAWECLAKARIPVVGLGPHSIPNLACDYVRDCVADAGTLIGRYLVRRNLRDIAFLCTTSRTIQGERITAIRKELARAGIELPEKRIFFVDAPRGYKQPPDPYADARDFMARLLDRGFRCECMVFGHDYPAVGALEAVLAKGIRVPDEIKLISCGRSGVEAISPMKLSTCFVDFPEQGRKAIQVLMRRIDGYDGPPEIHYTPVTLREGETT